MALVLDSTVEAKRYYRQTFEIKDANDNSVLLHTLLVNPEDMQMDEPARNSVTQTLGGAFVSDFGQGLPSVTLTGTTGYRKRVNAEGHLTDGYEEFVNFRHKVYRNFIVTNDPSLSLYWYNWEDDEYYEIHPQNFRLMRNKAEPLLYRYEFRFICINRLKEVKRVIPDHLTVPMTDRIQAANARGISLISQFLHALSN